MLQSINKKKIYFYIFIFLLLSSTFNSNIILKFKKLNLISQINILGLSEKEKKTIEKSLEIFINKNIFFINRKDFDKIIRSGNFLDNYEVIKTFPSKLTIKAKKTKFLGRTILKGEKFYIGRNGKLTKIFLVEKEYNLPQIFGSFEVNEFLKLQEQLNSNSFSLSKIKKYYYYKSKRWDIETNDGVILMLPSFDIDKSLKNYRLLLKTTRIKPGQKIDLRIKNKIILSNAKN